VHTITRGGGCQRMEWTSQADCYRLFLSDNGFDNLLFTMDTP
jgi:hypothetical protein